MLKTFVISYLAIQHVLPVNKILETHILETHKKMKKVICEHKFECT